MALAVFVLLTETFWSITFAGYDWSRFALSDPQVRQAVRVARGAAVSRGWSSFSVSGVEQGKDFKTGQECFLVHLVCFPPVFGGHATVSVTSQGQVLHYYGGK